MLAKDPDLRVGTVRKVAAELEQIASDLGLQNPFPMPGDILSLIDRPATVESLSNASLFSPTPRSAADTFIQEGATLLAPRAKAARAAWANWAAVAALLFIFGLGLMWQFGRGEDGPAAESGPAEILTVEPVGPDEVMVLVAKTEALGPERPQIDRFLWENLNQPLELSAALTGLRLREYPQVIRSEAEARQAAQKNGAALVIWGTYDQSFIDLNLSSFALMPAPLPESSLQKAANLRARLSDERSQSLAPQVLISTTVWYAYHSQPFEAAATMVAYYDLDLRPAETFGVSTGAEVYRHYENLYDDPQAATDFMTKALQGDPQNPLLYHLRAAAVDRTGNMEQALEDVETAQLLSQAAWPLPFLNEANLRSSQGDLAGGIAALTQAIALDPQEWLFYAVRGSYFYLDGDLAAAEADFRAAIERDPQANFPYVLLMNSSIQSGDIGEVQTLMATILEKFPDPTLGNRIILTAGNQPEFGGYYSLTLSAFNNLVLRQYGASLQDVQAALEIQPDSPDLHLFEGVVQCALGDLAAAEAAYSRGLEYKPDMTVLYLLRADVRNRLGDGAGGLEDFIAARQTTAWPNFEALVNEALAGGEGLGCESFFEVPG
jgi:tetratricopeptide (TPR) repeat protein